MTRKPVFDLVRRMLGRGFRKGEVAALDNALDAAGVPREGPDKSPPDPVPPLSELRVSPAGIRLIQRFEGLARLRPDGKVEAYPDPGTGGDPWTIGWGATGPGIGPGTVWTKAQCDARLVRDLARFAAEVAQALGDATTTQAQFDALASFHYNTGAIARSTLLRKHRAGDHEGAAQEFARWVHAGKRVLPGLVKRRAIEAALYREGTPVNVS